MNQGLLLHPLFQGLDQLAPLGLDLVVGPLFQLVSLTPKASSKNTVSCKTGCLRVILIG